MLDRMRSRLILAERKIRYAASTLCGPEKATDCAHDFEHHEVLWVGCIGCICQRCRFFGQCLLERLELWRKAFPLSAHSR